MNIDTRTTSVQESTSLSEKHKHTTSIAARNPDIFIKVCRQQPWLRTVSLDWKLEWWLAWYGSSHRNSSILEGFQQPSDWCEIDLLPHNVHTARNLQRVCQLWSTNNPFFEFYLQQPQTQNTLVNNEQKNSALNSRVANRICNDYCSGLEIGAKTFRIFFSFPKIKHWGRWACAGYFQYSSIYRDPMTLEKLYEDIRVILDSTWFLCRRWFFCIQDIPCLMEFWCMLGPE